MVAALPIDPSPIFALKAASQGRRGEPLFVSLWTVRTRSQVAALSAAMADEATATRCQRSLSRVVP